MKSINLVLGIVSLFGVGQAFPTADNLAKLAQREAHTPEQLHAKLAEIKAKRFIDLDPLSEPIQSKKKGHSRLSVHI